jgi:radical SAM superfamily enzyme YgiQ (UPF0313 family)
MRRVLFIHLAKPAMEFAMAHLGLASLAAILKNAGHEVTIFDEVLYESATPPALAEVLAEVRPDLIGFSTYTSTHDRFLQCLAEIRRLTDVPILVGGPHATLYAEELTNLSSVDYIVRGEAEDIIADLVAGASRQEKPVVITAEPPELQSLPWPDYTTVMNHQAMWSYPLVTSRGCPFQCSFCAIRRLIGSRWRSRDPQDCAAEVRAAVATLPNLKLLNVSDDCPSLDLPRFKHFLRLLLAEGLSLKLDVNNMRADRLDAEMIQLLKQAGADKQCIGVESGNPEVFALVNKGETLADIERAAQLIKEGGLELALCFVIGLPGDTLARHRDSIALVKRLQPSLIYWNMAHPFPGTPMHDWFLQHDAHLDDPRTYTSYDSHRVETVEPVVGTAEFSKEDRRRAYFLAVVETDQYWIDRHTPFRMLARGLQYGMLGPVLRSLSRRLIFGSGRRLKRWLAARWQARGKAA